MKALIQRVKEAEVTVNGESVGKIGQGLLVFLGVATTDTEKEVDYLAPKVANLRLFPKEGDEDGFDVSTLDAGHEMLIVSQFTLQGSCDKGRRPDFNAAAKPDQARQLYESFIEKTRALGVKNVQTGQFQAMMDVRLVNDGPATFMVESA